jgi:hypothetical protein
MDSSDFRRYLSSSAERPGAIRQNRLLSEFELYSCAQRRGFVRPPDKNGTVILRSASREQIGDEGQVLFHPFSLYALFQSRFEENPERNAAVNRIVDLAVLLAPI